MNESYKKIVEAGVLKPILEHKVIFLVFMSLPILVCTGAILLTAPIYESQALLQVGLVEGAPIEKIPDSVNRLERVLSQNMRVRLISGRLVEVSARAESAAKAHKYLTGITNEILNHHKKIFRIHHEPKVAYQTFLSDELKGIKKQLEELGEMSETSGNTNIVNAPMIHLRKVELRNSFLNLEDKNFRLRNNLLEDKWQQTELLQPPTFPESPKRPKPRLYLSLAVILGIALGLFSVFYANSLEHVTKRSHEKEK